MGRKVPLGTQAGVNSGKAVVSLPESMQEMLSAIQTQVERLTAVLYDVASKAYDKTTSHQFQDEAINLNKDGIPVGLSLAGMSTRGGAAVLTVANDGYFIGQQKFDSLSQAAEASSGVRRSGWSFWRLADGRTVREAFGKG